MSSGKKKISLIFDYRNVTCELEMGAPYWILKRLDRADRFKVYSTANRVVNSSCFKNIDFLTLDYTGKIGDRLVGNDEPAFTIAEAGANHNRELDTAKIEKTEW
jgi:hypothetical protein